MSVEQDASALEQNVVNALETDDTDASSSLINEVNTSLSNLSQPERDYMENSLALEGLLPDIAIKTGLVSEDQYIDKAGLESISKSEGNSSLKGMAARYLVEHYSELGRGSMDVNADYVNGFDIRIDMAVDTAQAMRNFPTILSNANSLGGKEAGTENGLTSEDLSNLLKAPDKLSEDERESLAFMKDNFDLMKTPRGIWRATDWSKPRITEQSLNEFVDTSLPLGFRKQLEIVQEDYKQHGDLKTRAQIASGEPKELPEVKPTDSSPVIPDSTKQDFEPPRVVKPKPLPEVQPHDTIPTVKADAGSIPSMVQPDSLPEQTAQDYLPKHPAQDSLPKQTEPDSLPNQTEPDSLPKQTAQDSLPNQTEPDSLPKQTAQDSLPKHPDTQAIPDTVLPDSTDTQPDQRSERPDEFGPNRAYQQESVERDKNPDEFGPQRHEDDESREKRVVDQKYQYRNFGDKQQETTSPKDQLPESDSQNEKQESKFKTIKLKSDATVEDFARSQLGQDASQEDIDALSKTIIDENDSINGQAEVIKAGDEIKVPKEIELKAVEKSYIVQEGDNLWNISKKHLREKTGTKPSNKDILEQVNKIVERNSIPNPDLIYPDQKIFIPGEVPEEVEPPEEVPPPEPETEDPGEKEKLVEKATEKFGDEPARLEEFKEDVEAFEQRAEREGLPAEEVDATFKEVKRLLDAEGDTPLNDAQREKLARQVMDQAAHPTTIDQGNHNTCNMNTVEVRTYSRKPSVAAKIVADVGIDGKYTTKDGMTIETDATPHGESKSDVDYDGNRTHASEIFQVTTANVYLEQQNRSTTPPGKLRYEQRDRIPGEPRGEGLFDYSTDPPSFIKASPNINTRNVGKLADVYKSITGEDAGEMILGHSSYIRDTSDSVRRIDSEDGLNEYLTKAKEDGNFPIVVAVETTNEPFWTDSGRATAGGSGGGHVVTITDYEPGPPSKVAIDNSWGVDDDHDASDPVDVHKLFIAMQNPRDNVSIIENDTKEAREAGKPDHVAEFELLRVQRLLGTTTNDQYTDRLIEAINKAKEDWDNGIEVDGKENALKKFDRLAGGLPRAQRERLREHKESLGV